jgi:glycosyltransferase 2 family protein
MNATLAPSEAPRPRSRLRRFVTIGLLICAAVGLLDVAGWNIRGWFSNLWDVLTQISAGYIVAGILLVIVQTTATATGWYWILRTAYGKERVSRRVVLACYATAVALNGWLPANLGTLVCLLMFVATIAGATFSGILGGYAVQKIFFTVAGAFVYLYLFLSVGGSFDIKFSWVHEHWQLTILIIVGAVVLVVLLVKMFWPKIRKFWERAKEGGQVLGKPRIFFVHVVWPQFIGWCASLCVIGVFLAAYAIPVTFHTIMSVVGGNSIANVASFTPGGVGVNQAFNVASLNSVTDATTATAYSVSQQLITTAWNQIFAIAMIVWVFGWSGGKKLVEDSYVEAKQKAAERKKKPAAEETA